MVRLLEGLASTLRQVDTMIWWVALLMSLGIVAGIILLAVLLVIAATYVDQWLNG
jgi:hypothetical protein